MEKTMFKKSPKELQQYLYFKRRGYIVQAKKGKGSYSRNKSIEIYGADIGFDGVLRG